MDLHKRIYNALPPAIGNRLEGRVSRSLDDFFFAMSSCLGITGGIGAYPYLERITESDALPVIGSVMAAYAVQRLSSFVLRQHFDNDKY